MIKIFNSNTEGITLYLCVCILLSRVWLLATPWTEPPRFLYPWESSRQECWSGLQCPAPGDLPNPGIESRSPALQADSLPSELPGKPVCIINRAYCVHLHSVLLVKTSLVFIMWNRYLSSNIINICQVLLFYLTLFITF